MGKHFANAQTGTIRGFMVTTVTPNQELLDMRYESEGGIVKDGITPIPPVRKLSIQLMSDNAVNLYINGDPTPVLALPDYIIDFEYLDVDIDSIVCEDIDSTFYILLSY